MKPIFYICVFVLASVTLSAESIPIDRDNVISVPCSTNPSVNVFAYAGWTIYQTENNTWNGAVLTTGCIDLIQNLSNGEYEIDLNTIDPTRALFLSYNRLQSESIALKKNSMYLIWNRTFHPDTPLSTDCENEICTGLILRTQHFENGGLDTISKVSKLLPNLELNCMVTEKTEFNQVTDLVLKFSFDNISMPTLKPRSILYNDEDMSILDDNLIIPEVHWNNSEYNCSIREIFDPINVGLIVQHNLPGFPEPDNQSEIEFIPEINSTTPKPINVDFYSTPLHFQEYTRLVGGRLEGSTERHPLNLILDELNCLYLIDLVGSDGTSFHLKAGGGFEFSDKTACLQLRNNSALVVKSKVTTQLGRSGIGNFNLRSGGKVVLEPESALILDCHIIISDYSEYTGNEEIHIDLQKNSHLEFTENARITNKLYGQNHYLFIHMNGGTVDLSKLSSEDRNKIILVYPEQSDRYSELQIFPNPTSEIVSIHNPKKKLIESIELYDLSSRRVKSYSGTRDSTLLHLNVADLNSGAYMLITYFQNSRTTQKLIIE